MQRLPAQLNLLQKILLTRRRNQRQRINPDADRNGKKAQQTDAQSSDPNFLKSRPSAFSKCSF